MAIGLAFGLMSAFFLVGMYVAAALGCLSLIMMFFFSDARYGTSCPQGPGT